MIKINSLVFSLTKFISQNSNDVSNIKGFKRIGYYKMKTLSSKVAKASHSHKLSFVTWLWLYGGIRSR